MEVREEVERREGEVKGGVGGEGRRDEGGGVWG